MDLGDITLSGSMMKKNSFRRRLVAEARFCSVWGLVVMICACSLHWIESDGENLEDTSGEWRGERGVFER